MKRKEIFLYYCDGCKIISVAEVKMPPDALVIALPCTVCKCIRAHRPVAIGFAAQVFFTRSE
jgi:hypothetical protein